MPVKPYTNVPGIHEDVYTLSIHLFIREDVHTSIHLFIREDVYTLSIHVLNLFVLYNRNLPITVV